MKGRFRKLRDTQPSNDHKVTSKKMIGCLVCALLATLAAFATINAVKLDLAVDEEQSFSATHFLMMGFNEETMGLYSQDDVNETQSHSTKAERQAANLRIWADRVASEGPTGVAKLFIKKNCSNYADGTMSWAQEGGFWRLTPHTEGFIPQVYGFRSPLPSPFAPVAQVIWFLILLGAFAACVLGQRNPAKSAICLSLLFLSIFLLLFECRARYLFLYLPYFIVAGTIGWKSVMLTKK